MKDLLRQDVDNLTDDARTLFSNYSVSLSRHPCERTSDAGLEMIFVICRLGGAILIYDDVEDEYGIGNDPKGLPLKEWMLYGSLESALTGLVNDFGLPAA